MIEEIALKDQHKIVVEKREKDDRINVLLHIRDKKNCRLHWGISNRPGGRWKLPPETDWPAGSIAVSDSALQTPFLTDDSGCNLSLELSRDSNHRFMNFVLFYPESNRWDNNHGKNYQITIADGNAEAVSIEIIAERHEVNGEIIFDHAYPIDSESQLLVKLYRVANSYKVIFLSDIQSPLILHWGVGIHSPLEWDLPPASMLKEGIDRTVEGAVQTDFSFENGVNKLELEFDQEDAPLGLSFVLKIADEQCWLKNRGRNFYVPVKELEDSKWKNLSGLERQIYQEIVHSEMGRNSWTLMHRFNLCYDLLEDAVRDENCLALVFVWMRFSFLRQLDWQRNYNTKPRELSHAQDRLTLRLAGLYSEHPEKRELIRLIMSTLGKGGEGQRIRDEILQIMHRHHIKEVAGSFMEEWHQKLHNNTTPDDIAICEAYIEFLKSNGNLELFYKTLEASGVTKARLESFERPIVTPPDFIPHLKDALLHDFENYLKLLKSVHSGTDLESAVDSASYLLDNDMCNKIDFVLRHKYDSAVPAHELAHNVTDLRDSLNNRLSHEKNSGIVRDILYLDLALEEYLRMAVERNIHLFNDIEEMFDLISGVLKNIIYSYDYEELRLCNEHIGWLGTMPSDGREWLLQVHSVIERIGRVISYMSDRYYNLLQGRAESLGREFKAEDWIIRMFSEEVIRGRLSFILSMIVHRIDPLLRHGAHLGHWQVISPADSAGYIVVTDKLRTFHGKSFDRPTVVIADEVHGDEEPPDGIVAVITNDRVDLVAHVAIRARNANILFATCYDEQVYQDLRSYEGRLVRLTVNTSGDVEVREVDQELSAAVSRISASKELIKPEFCSYAISEDEFNSRIVGSKSNNLAGLRSRLPDWINLPRSAAVPFGVFEKVLELDINNNIAGRYCELLAKIDQDPGETLSKIRSVILDLKAPDNMMEALKSAMIRTGLQWTANRDDLWMCIKRVWASKWNERAYFSRTRYGIAHEDLFMAVLIQEVINADYAFVIHTVNPLNDNPDELYAEVVPGLGETLVGNYPGRALGFIFNKKSGTIDVMTYPSKSVALKGGGLIFRSDSNGEDLSEYAGAGLYDSIMLEKPFRKSINYANEPIIRDPDLRNSVLLSTARIGVAIEGILASAQDIEGAYSDGRFFVVQTRPQV